MVFRVFSGIIGFVFFAFLVLLTFFSGANSDISNISTDKTSLGIFNISASGGVLIDADNQESNSRILFEQISTTDRIYFTPGSQYTVEGNFINIEKGEFIFSIKSLATSYVIIHESLDINPLGIGDIYLNTNEDRNYGLLSLDGILEVNLKSDSDIVTQAYLYPHMYLKFNPFRAQFLKNADLVRISSVYTLDTISDSISMNSSDAIISKLGGKNLDFLPAYIDFTTDEIAKNNKIFTKVYNLKTFEFPGIRFIKKYFYLLLNDSKKQAYYKNSIFSNVIKLVKSKDDQPDIISQILTELDLLSDSGSNQEDIIEIIKFYHNISMLNSNASNIYAKVNLYSLLAQIENKKTIDDPLSYFSLHSLYQNFNFNENYSYQDLISFSRSYFESNKVFSKDVSLDKKEKLDYFSFFLGKIFVSKFSPSDENLREFGGKNNLSLILEVMNDYIKLSNTIYDSTGDERNVTGMYVHLDILEKLEDFVRNGLFRTERGINGILIKSRKFEINIKELGLLEENIGDLFDFYEKNKDFISNNNQQEANVIADYNDLSSKFTEYFLALRDYESYIYNYDETKRSLFGIKTLGENDEVISFSIKSAREYLSSFFSASLTDTKIELQDNYYVVTDFIVNGKNFSFSLYPFDRNRIDNIFINKKAASVSYKLDIVESDWNERLKTTSGESEKIKYDFSRFFLNTFSSASSNDVDIFEIDKSDNNSNDKFINVFKRDKLLGSQGEFTSIKSFLDISFNDIDVVARNNSYDIFINNSDVKIESDQGGFTAALSSDYILQEDKHYFKNIRLYPYQSNIGVKKPMFGENFIQVVGNINLVDLEDQLTFIQQANTNIGYIYNSILKNLNVDEMSIRYLKASKKVNFRFDYQGDSISILLSVDTIENISKGGEVLLRDVNYRTIGDILNTIKK